MDNLVEVKNLSLEFHGQELSEKIVNNISFQIKDKEIVGIVGESGSGKTLTALAIAGLLRRHAMKLQGEIKFAGTDLAMLSREELRKYQGKDISMVFQEPMSSLNPVMKIGKQVEESLRVHTKHSKRERKEKAIEALRSAELPEPEKLYHQYPHELSGGMRQRVMIAAALIGEPKLIIADEPTTALDVTIQGQIVKLFQKINQERGTSILFISHDLSLVYKLCHRAIVMHQGQIVEEGITEELFHNPQHSYTKGLIAAIPTINNKR